MSKRVTERVWCASGALNFDGKGYPYHRLPPWRWASWEGARLVTKTVTLRERQGNMPLKDDGVTPRAFRPSCIKAYFWRGMLLNAVNLSNRGLLHYCTHAFHAICTPFKISLAATAMDSAGRQGEMEEMAKILGFYLPRLHPEVGFQLNFQCPNAEPTRLERRENLDCVLWLVEILAKLGRWVDVKFSLADSMHDVAEVAQHSACHGVTVSNGARFGQMPDLIPWNKLFSGGVSPLAEYGGGTLSGRPLMPVLLRKIAEAQEAGIRKPLGVGGGIMAPEDAERAIIAGRGLVQWVELGAIGLLRPWKVASTIKSSQDCFRLLI